MNSEGGAGNNLYGGLLLRIEAWVHAIAMYNLYHNLGSKPDRARAEFSLASARVRNAQGSLAHMHVCAMRWE
jgi:hypothetical protein